MSDTVFLKIAKFFVYIAPLSMLIVASSMFFPFIVGKAIFFRIMVELGLFFYLLCLLSPGSREKIEEFKRTAKNPIFLSIAAFTLLFLISAAVANDPQVAFWFNFERGEWGPQVFLYCMFFYGAFFFKQNAKGGIRIALAFFLAFQAFVFIYLSQSRNGIAGVTVGILALLVYWSMRGGEIKVYKFNIRQISVALIALVVISAGIFVSTRTNPFWQEVPGLRRFANANLLTGLTDRIWVWG